jgi:hypothetical protein
VQSQPNRSLNIHNAELGHRGWVTYPMLLRARVNRREIKAPVELLSQAQGPQIETALRCSFGVDNMLTVDAEDVDIVVAEMMLLSTVYVFDVLTDSWSLHIRWFNCSQINLLSSIIPFCCSTE